MIVLAVTATIAVIAQNNIVITTIRGTEMVKNRVRVMFSTPLASDAMIPKGFWLDHRFLEPNLPMQPGTYAKAPSQALTEARRKVLCCAVLAYEGDMDPDQAARMLLKNENVVFAEPWYVMSVQGVPNDPLFVNQQALRLMKVPEAWDVSSGSEAIVVAVVDNGIDQNHEDLKPAIYTNNAEVPGNMIDDDGNGFVDDFNGCNLTWAIDQTDPGNTSNNGANGHGTNVAGIVGAATNNGKGIAGMGNGFKIFPIKAAPTGTGSLVYGYEGMLYAANQGFKVINCSWGSQSRPGAVKPFSLIDKSVVDYCIAKGCLIVSSAGNHGNGAGGAGWLEFNYPSAYDGVMGVAECDVDEKVAATSGLGRNSQITAPSTDAVTTVSGGGYTAAGINGTSFASPMGAGAAALVLSRWPQLQPRQVVALLQATAVDIKGRSPWAAKALQGRLDVLSAVSADPSSIPGFRIVSTRIKVRDVVATSFGNGDTLAVYLTVKNELGTSAPLTCALRVLDPAGWIVAIINPSIPHAPIAAGESVVIGPYNVVVTRFQDKPCMMDITFADGVHNQRLITYIEPPATMTTLMNNELSYSIGNRGMFGFGSTLANNMQGNGTGVGWRTRFQDLGWTGGLLFCTSDGKALRAYDNMQDISDFTAEKPFALPDTNVAILTDASAGQREIGVRIHERCTFPSVNSLSTVIEIKIENRSVLPMQDVAAGYFFDWDIGANGANNRSRHAPEALPTSFKEMGEAEVFYRDDTPIVVACAAVSGEAIIEGQVAGMVLGDYVEDSDRLSDGDIVTLLTSGSQIQTNTVGDACGVIGMRFPGALQPGESKTFMIVIGVGETIEEATTNVRETVLNPSSVQEKTVESALLWPNPVNTVLNISSVVPMNQLTIVNALGERVYEQQVSPGTTIEQVQTQLLPNGMYRMLICNENGMTSYPFCINR